MARDHFERQRTVICYEIHLQTLMSQHEICLRSGGFISERKTCPVDVTKVVTIDLTKCQQKIQKQ